jgi:hypothetical protein
MYVRLKVVMADKISVIFFCRAILLKVPHYYFCVIRHREKGKKGKAIPVTDRGDP